MIINDENNVTTITTVTAVEARPSAATKQTWPPQFNRPINVYMLHAICQSAISKYRMRKLKISDLNLTLTLTLTVAKSTNRAH